ncbi:MAG: LamG domain-containing protein [Planctomycetota bacterium]|nr:MAG: LamG domain-containing protein [Planctomycetota bacterium]
MVAKGTGLALAVVLGGLVLFGVHQRATGATLHAYWAFDGNGNDASGNGLDATIEGAAAFGGGVVGDALLLDGTDDRAVVADDPLLDFDTNDAFSLALWLRIDVTHQAPTTASLGIVEKWAGSGGYPYTLRALLDGNRNPTGKIYAGRYDGSSGVTVSSPVVFDDGGWHHVAFVKDGTTLTLYIDGAAVGTSTDTLTGSTLNASALYIGSRAAGQYLAGAIDELRIYGGALTASEVQTLAAVPVPEPSALALATALVAGLLIAGRPVRDGVRGL